MHCVAVPPREAGYTRAPAFLAAPAAGLGALEASALAVYGDLVALSEGQTRQWAIAGLVGAARRAALWGRDAGALARPDRRSGRVPRAAGSCSGPPHPSRRSGEAAAYLGLASNTGRPVAAGALL